MLNEKYDGTKISESKKGSKRIARMNLTLNTYTQWYWNRSFNLMNFLRLRADHHAQYEMKFMQI